MFRHHFSPQHFKIKDKKKKKNVNNKFCKLAQTYVLQLLNCRFVRQGKVIVHTNEVRDALNIALAERWAKRADQPLRYYRAYDQRVRRRLGAEAGTSTAWHSTTTSRRAARTRRRCPTPTPLLSHQCCHPASSPSNRNNQKHSKCKRTNNQYPSNVVKSRSTPTTQSRRTKYTTMMSSFRLLTFDSFQSQGRTLAGVVHVVSESVRQRSLYVPWSRMRRSSDLAIVFHRPFALKDLQKQSPAKSVLAFMQRARQRSDRTQQYQKYQQQ
jgi:hypothetical protein